MKLSIIYYLRKEALATFIACTAVFIIMLQFHIIFSIIFSIALLFLLRFWLLKIWKNKSLFIIKDNTISIVNNEKSRVENIENVDFIIIENKNIFEIFIENIEIRINGKMYSGYFQKEKNAQSTQNLKKHFNLVSKKKNIYYELETYIFNKQR